MTKQSIIRASARAIVQSALGAGAKPLPYQINYQTNDDRSLILGYAVTWGLGQQVYSIDQVPNLEHELHVIMTKRVFIRNDDEKIEDGLDELYGAIEIVMTRFILDKLDNRDIIQWVELRNLDEPRMIGNGRDTVSVQMIFRIRYLIQP